MANTKKLSKEERKKAKRHARHELKKLYQSLSKKQRSEFNASNVGIKKFVQELKEKESKTE